MNSLSIVLVLLVASIGSAQNFSVSSSGIDALGCGDITNPCRTLFFTLDIINNNITDAPVDVHIQLLTNISNEQIVFPSYLSQVTVWIDGNASLPVLSNVSLVMPTAKIGFFSLIALGGTTIQVGSLFANNALFLEISISANQSAELNDCVVYDGLSTGPAVTAFKVTINGCTFFDNSAGALYINGGGGLINSTSFFGNSATLGAAVYFRSVNSNLTVVSSSFSYNAATYGGAFYVEATGSLSNLTIISSTITFNDVSYGGAFYVEGNGALILDSSSDISENEASYGGAIVFGSSANFHLVGGYLNNNEASIAGGGIYLQPGSSATISNTIIVASANYGAGTIWLESSSLSLESSSIRNNKAEGLIAKSSRLIITSSNLTGNVNTEDINLINSSSLISSWTGVIVSNKAAISCDDCGNLVCASSQCGDFRLSLKGACISFLDAYNCSEHTSTTGNAPFVQLPLALLFALVMLIL